jgi:RNA polymerase sigma factor (sigma-70 family)
MEENQVIDGLRKRESAAYNLLYTFYYPTIESFVKRNNGTSADAKDIFQETIIVLLEKVPKKDFILTSSIKTYIFAVASNIWLKRLRDAKKVTQLGPDFEMEDMTLAEWEQHEETRAARNSIQRVFHKISRHCFVFLTKTFLTGITREKLVEEMGYKNSHTFDNQKYKCLEQARKTIS